MEKTITFDLEGTLPDSFGDIHAALNKILLMRGATPHDLTTVRGFIGGGFGNLVRRALTARNLPIDAGSCNAKLSDFFCIFRASSLSAICRFY